MVSSSRAMNSRREGANQKRKPRVVRTPRASCARVEEGCACTCEGGEPATDRRCHGAVRHIHRRSYVYVSGAAERRGAATRAKFSKTKRNSKLRKELRADQRVNV